MFRDGRERPAFFELNRADFLFAFGLIVIIQIVVQFDVVEIVFVKNIVVFIVGVGFCEAEKERSKRFERPFESVGFFVAGEPEAFAGHGIKPGGKAPFGIDVDGGVNGLICFIDNEIVGDFGPDSLCDAEVLRRGEDFNDGLDLVDLRFVENPSATRRDPVDEPAGFGRHAVSRRDDERVIHHGADLETAVVIDFCLGLGEGVVVDEIEIDLALQQFFREFFMDLRCGFPFGSARPDGTDVVEEGDVAVRTPLPEDIAKSREVGVPQFGIRPQRIVRPALGARIDVEQVVFRGHFIAAEDDRVDAADELEFDQPFQLERCQAVAEDGGCFRHGAVVAALARDGGGVFRKDMGTDAGEELPPDDVDARHVQSAQDAHDMAIAMENVVARIVFSSEVAA